MNDIDNTSSLTAELEKLRAENELLKNNVQELTVTNDHLVSATWREREMKEELRKIKETLEYHNSKINESISYAKNIQQSMISSEDCLEKAFDDPIIFYKPKDVVSGDFPWSFTKGNTTYFGAIDCTGHGVPGAMLAIVGNILLDDLCYFNNDSPDAILNYLHEKVVKVLKQKSGDTNLNDGMDLGLCKFNAEEHKLEFSGAHRPLIVIRKDGEFIEMKGDRQAIGGVQGRKSRRPFSLHSFDVRKGDKVFLFSDGLQDQFGGPDKTKYGMKRLRHFLKSNQKLSLIELKQKLIEEWTDWKGDHAQIDDVLLMGVQI